MMIKSHLMLLNFQILELITEFVSYLRLRHNKNWNGSKFDRNTQCDAIVHILVYFDSFCIYIFLNAFVSRPIREQKVSSAKFGAQCEIDFTLL